MFVIKVFIGTLTTREHLQFQATLRMDQKISLKERMKTVEKIIDEVVSISNLV